MIYICKVDCVEANGRDPVTGRPYIIAACSTHDVATSVARRFIRRQAAREHLIALCEESEKDDRDANEDDHSGPMHSFWDQP